MKRILRNAIAILCCIGLLSSCATSSTLQSVATPYNEVYTDDGESMQVVEDERFLISAEGLSIEDGIGQVLISIGNKGDYGYRFHEDSVEFFGGNLDEERWYSLGTWSAREYHDYLVRRSSSGSAAPLFAFLVGLGVIGTMLDVYDDVDCFDFEDAFFTTWLISSSLDSGYDTYSSLDDNLLHTRTVYGREVYSGLVAFRSGEYPDYMIRLDLDGDGPYEFVFQRNDRERYL